MSIRIVFTGQSGLNKRPIVEELKMLAEQRQRTVLFFSVGEMMYNRSDVQRGRMLRQDLTLIEQLRSRVLDEITDAASNQPGADIYIDTHATFRWNRTPFRGFHPQEIVDLSPDLSITFIDDVDEIKAGLRKSDYPWDLSLRDIMIWREEELLVSELLSSLVSACKHYVVPRNLDTSSLMRLIYEPNSPKCYLSFPISGHIPQVVQEQIETFRQAFHALENVVIFDPLKATDEPLLIVGLKKSLGRNPNAKTMRTRVTDEMIDLKINELKEIEPYVADQTRAFDLMMVGQCDTIVAFIPEYRGKPFAAPGVITELNYAGYKGKRILLIWPAESAPTLMLDPDETFETVEEARGFFINN